MAELLERPDEVPGNTHKIKTPHSEHAIYITFNRIEEEDGQAVPIEIFVNSKCMDSFSWITALTRVISAIFREGGSATFLIGELKAVFDPNGGYYKRGGLYIPSIAAEVGYIIEMELYRLDIAPLSESGKAYAEAHRSLF